MQLSLESVSEFSQRDLKQNPPLGGTLLVFPLMTLFLYRWSRKYEIHLDTVDHVTH